MARGPRTPGQIYALGIGVVYLAVGLIGFFFADQFTVGSSDDYFVGFRLNHLHNIVHLGLGVAWIGASARPAAARGVNALLGVVLLLVAVLGFTASDFAHTLLNITSATEPDNFLHLVTGALGLVFAAVPAQRRAS